MANEIQLITLSAAPQHGSFKLTFDGQETGSIAYDANAATIQAALEALSTIGSGNVSVTVDGLVITIEFVGALASTDVSAVSVTSNTLGRNTIETLSLDGVPAAGSVGARYDSNVSYSELFHSDSTAQIEASLEGSGAPASLTVSGNWHPTGFTLTTPADVSLLLNGGGTFGDSEENPLTLTYTKTQAYSAVTATPSTQQNGAPGPIMIVKAPTGLTLSAKLFERGSDTLVETVTLTERTNAKGVYEGEVTEPATGWHHVVILAGASPIGVQDVYLTADPVEHYVGDYCPIEDPSGLLATAGLSAADVAATVAAAITAEHGSGSYTTANISTLATASQLGSSSAQLLSGINDLKATGSALLATAGATQTTVGTLATASQLGSSSAAILSSINNLPTATQISNTVSAALTSEHGSGAWTTANVSGLATTNQLASSSAALLAAIPSTSAIKAAVWSSVSTNTGLTMEKLIEVTAAGSPAGKVSGAGTGTETFKHVGSTAAAMVVTVDSSGNRSAVTIP